MSLPFPNSSLPVGVGLAESGDSLRMMMALGEALENGLFWVPRWSEDLAGSSKHYGTAA